MNKYLLKKADIKDFLKYLKEIGAYPQWIQGVVEPGYDDKPLVLADWNNLKTAEIAEIIENKLNMVIGFDDEWTTCGECYNAVRTNSDGYDWTPYYIIFDTSELICLNCAREDMGEVIKHYKNNCNEYIPTELLSDIKKEGFEQVKKEFAHDYWVNGVEIKVVEETIIKNFPNYDYIFNMSQNYSFQGWLVFIREKEEEDAF